MRQSLVAKLTASLTIGTGIILAAYGLFGIQREVRLFEQSKREYGEVLGHTLAKQMAENWRHQGKPRALELLDRFDRRHREIEIRWVSLGDNPTHERDPHLTSEELARLKDGRAVTVEKYAWGTSAVSFHTYIPVPFDEADAGAIEIVDTFTDRAAYTHASVRRLLTALVGFVAVAAVIALTLSSWLVGRPIAKLIAKTQEIARGDYTSPIDVRQTDELGELARAMQTMSSQLSATRRKLQEEEESRRKAELELRHADRLTTVGKLAAGVAHELGTPLNVVSGRAKRVSKRHSDDETLQDVRIIRDQVEKMAKIVSQLLHLARRQGPQMDELEVNRLLRDTAGLLQTPVRKHGGVQLVANPLYEDLRVRADAMQLQQVISNLVINAAQAMPDGGIIELGAEGYRGTPAGAGESLPEGNYVRIYVRDEGHGIPPEVRERMFEPFFTTKDVGEGTGLGLTVAYGIVKDHGGCIAAESTEDGGSCVSVYLPRTGKATVAA